MCAEQLGARVCIAAVIRAGLAHHEDAASIEARIQDAELARIPLTFW